jgi:hypothetical protein
MLRFELKSNQLMQGLICNLYNAEGAFCKNLGFDQITKYFRLEKHMNQACELIDIGSRSVSSPELSRPAGSGARGLL